MSIYDFVGAFFSNTQPESEFERLKREAREEIYNTDGNTWKAPILDPEGREG